MERNVSYQEYTVSTSTLNVKDFVKLRQKIGWGEIDFELAEESIKNSLFCISILHQSTMVAMGRVVGDGHMYFYIQDVIVDPQFQNTGLGNVVMEHIESYLLKAAKKGSTIGLLAAKGKEGFYKRFGYIERIGDPLGCGMCKFL